MEWFNPTLSTLIIGAIGAIILLYHKVHFWARKGIPHVKPLLLFGNNAPLFFRRKALSDHISHVYNSFPDARFVGMMNFHTPVAVLRDPQLIKETCIKDFEHFLDHRSYIDETTDPIFGKNLFSLRGDHWKKMRNTLSPSFTASKMKFMFELVEKCSRDFVQYFLDHPDATDSVDTKDVFTRYANDVIATYAFGISINSMKDQNNEFYIRGKDASALGSVFRLLKYFIFRVCPKVMHSIGEPFLSRATDRFFKSIVRDTLKTREENNIVRPDMIHLLLEARDKDNGVKMSADDIVAQAFIFFLAGFDPTSTAMCFIAHSLAMDPEIQEKLRDEVDSFTKNTDSKISYETLSKMKYLDMVISEGLRKYPPAPITDRLCVKKYVFPKPTPESREYIAEVDTKILIPIHSLHHDPKYFPNPDKFDPERFSDENKDKIHPYTYLPFGVGPRHCIGNRFALMGIKLLFVHILQNFILEPTAKTKHPLEFDISVNVTVVGGTWVKLTKRES